MYSGVSGTEAGEDGSKYIGSKLLIMERIKSCFSLLISWVKSNGGYRYAPYDVVECRMHESFIFLGSFSHRNIVNTGQL
jgi:hypothetical protein